MSITVFSSTGCIRCEIVKNYLAGRGLAFVEHDIKTAQGNEAFKIFYKENRAKIRRDQAGIFFPVVSDAGKIVQDAGVSLAWFMAGDALNGMLSPSNLGHGWIGGLDISNGNPDNFAAFLEILRLLKAGGLCTELSSNGKNPDLLREALKEKLADRLCLNLSGEPESAAELEESLKAAKEHNTAAEFSLVLDINGRGGLISPARSAELARLMAEATGDKRLPLRIKNSAPEQINLFPYRTEARRWQLLTELA